MIWRIKMTLATMLHVSLILLKGRPLQIQRLTGTGFYFLSLSCLSWIACKSAVFFHGQETFEPPKLSHDNGLGATKTARASIPLVARCLSDRKKSRIGSASYGKISQKKRLSSPYSQKPDQRNLRTFELIALKKNSFLFSYFLHHNFWWR